MSKKFREILTKSKYREGSKKYKDDIKNNVLKSIQFIHTELHAIFTDPVSEPNTLLYAGRMLKDGVQLGNPSFVGLVQEPGKGVLYELQRIISQFKTQKMQDYGKTLFGVSPTEEEKTIGKSIAFLLIECVQVWAIWFQWDERSKNPTNFQKVYQMLKQSGIQYPGEGQMTYFKDDEKLKFQGAITQGGKLPPPQKSQQEKQEEEEETNIKLEDFENLKEEVRKHLDDKIKEKIPKITEYFKDFLDYFTKNEPPSDPELKNLYLEDLQACEKVLVLIKQINANKITVQKFLQEITPLVQECDQDILGVGDDELEQEIQQLKEELADKNTQITNQQKQMALLEKNNKSLESLKKQSELEQKNFEIEIAGLKKQNTNLEKSISSLNDQLEQAEAKAKQQSKASSKSEIDTTQINKLQNQLNSANSEIDNLNMKIQDLSNENEEYQNQIAKQKREITKLNEQNDKYQNDIKNTSKLFDNQDDELNNAKRQILNLESKISTQELEMRKKNQQIQEIQDQLEEYDEAKNKYEQDLEQEKKKHQIEINQEIQKNKDALEKANMEYVDTYIKLDNQIQQNAEKDSQISTLQQKIQILQLQQTENNESERFEQTEKIYQEQLLQHKNKQETLQTQLKSLETQLSESNKHKSNLQDQVNKLQKEHEDLNTDYMKEQADLRKAEQKIRVLESEKSNNKHKTPNLHQEQIIEEEEDVVVLPAAQDRNQQAAVRSKNPNAYSSYQGGQNGVEDKSNPVNYEQKDKQPNSENILLQQRLQQMEEKQRKMEQELEFTKKLNTAQMQLQQSQVQFPQSQLMQTSTNFGAQPRQGYHTQTNNMQLSRSNYYSPQQLQRPQSVGKTNQQPIKISQYFGNQSQVPPQVQAQKYATSTNFYNPSAVFQKSPQNKQKIITFDSQKFNFRGFTDQNSIVRFQKSCYKHKYPIYSKENELVIGLMSLSNQNSSNLSNNRSNISSSPDSITFQLYFTNKGQFDINNLSFLMDEINIPKNSMTTERLEVGQQKKMEIHFQFKGDQKIIWATLQYNIGKSIMRQMIPIPNNIYRYVEQIDIEPGMFQEKWENCLENVQQTETCELEVKVVDSIIGFQSKLNLVNLNQNNFAQTYSGNTFNVKSALQSLGGLYQLKTTNTKILFKVEGRENIVTFYASHINTNEKEAQYHTFVVENFLQTMIMIFTKMNRF